MMGSVRKYMKRMGVAILLASFLICLSACGAKGTNDSVSTDGFAAENVNGMSESKDAVEEDKAEVGKFNFEKRTVMLNSGYEMPIMGLGTYSLSDEECYNSVTALLESGGRLIDTAYMYGNDVICCEL